MVGGGLEQELRRRAEATVVSIRNEAREEVKRLELEANREFEARRRSSLREDEREYRRAAQRRVAAQRREALSAVLLAQARVVDRVLERARALLPSAGGSDGYLSTVPDQVSSSLRFVGRGDVVIRCKPEILAIVKQALEEGSSVTVKADPEISAGFTVSAHSGAVHVDMRLESLLEWRRPELAIVIQSGLRRE